MHPEWDRQGLHGGKVGRCTTPLAGDASRQGPAPVSSGALWSPEPAAMTTENLRRTPLYDAHAALGARLVPFAGW
jgi:hypothetical protein